PRASACRFTPPGTRAAPERTGNLAPRLARNPQTPSRGARRLLRRLRRHAQQRLSPARIKRHHGERRPVRLVVVVERIVEPRAVVSLRVENQARKVMLVKSLLRPGKLLDAQSRVIVPEVEEVPGAGKEGFMRDRLLPPHAEPAVARPQPVQP